MDENPALRLYTRSLAGQWNADRDIDNHGLRTWARGSLAGAGSVENDGIFVLPGDEGRALTERYEQACRRFARSTTA